MSLSVAVVDEKNQLKPDPADRPAALLYTLTDLYVLKPSHSPDEERQFTELAIRLIDAIDIPTRRVVAQRLEHYGRAPKLVMDYLAQAVSPPATPLEPATPLVPHIESASEIVAPTETIAPAETVETDELALPEPAPTPLASELPANPDHDTLAAEAVELIELFFTADAGARTLILQNLDLAPLVPADPLHEKHVREAERRLEVAALARNSYEFATILVGTVGITQSLAVRIAQDPSGEPLILALRALGIAQDIVQRIVLFLNPGIGESVARVYELMRLHDEISPETARRMLTVWRMASAARFARHEPVLHDDEERRARAESAMMARRVVNRGLDRARRA